jgi:hypothetical protein
VYVVKFADDRHAKRRKPLSAAFNLRQRNGTAYVTATLNAGVAWTWATLVSSLWGSAIGGAVPALPYTPHGTPEGFDFYAADSALDALNEVLVRIDCALVHDPRTLTYTIRRSGADKAKLTQFDARQTVVTWNDLQEQWPQTDWPATLRVRFRRTPVPTDGNNPYFTVDAALPNPPAGRTAGTTVTVDDDLYALNATGTPSNSATLSARATERAAEFVRRRSSLEFPTTRSYKGIAADAFDLLGESLSAVAIADRGGNDGAALTTEVCTERDYRLATWRWGPAVAVGAGVATCTPGFIFTQTVTKMECDAFGSNLITEFAYAVMLNGCPGAGFTVAASGNVADTGAPVAGAVIQSNTTDPNTPPYNLATIATTGAGGTWSGVGTVEIDATSPTPSYFVRFVPPAGYTPAEAKYYNNPGPITAVNFSK